MKKNNIKILAIDDKNDNLISLKAIIKDLFPNSAIFTELNGAEGITTASAENPDVILLDIVMPDMDGFEVCRLLKKNERTRDIPVVFLTALKGDRESRIKALEAGAEAFLSKPIDETELTAQIRAMVKIKEANLRKRNEKEYLEKLVSERTSELEQSRVATLNLLDDLKAEIEVRKNMEKELTASKLYLNNIINSVASPIFVKDCEYKFLLVNNALCTLLNQPAEKLIGRTGFEHFPDDQNNVFLAKDKEVFITGKENINEEFLTDGTGEIRTIVTRKTLYVDPAGNKFLVGVINDITERKKAEQKLSVMAKMLDVAPGAITVHDINGKFLYTNQKNLDLHGYELDEFLNLNLHDVDVPESEELINERIEKIKKTGEASFEVRHFKKDGSTLPLQVFTKIIDWNKNPALISVASDITDRLKSEQAIRESENKFRNLITQMQSGLAVHEIILDEKGIPVDYRFLDVNPSFERLTGLKKADIIGKTVLEILPETEKLWIEKYGRVALTGEPVSFENYHQELDRFYSIVAYQPREKQFAVVIEDVTNRKKAEEKLKENLALLRIAGEVTKMGGWNVNLKENRSYWSDEVAAIHEMPAGFTPPVEEGIGFYAPEWREKITQVFTDCAKKGIPYNERMEIITATGKRIWIKTIGEAVRNEKGEILKVHGAFQDISDQVKSEESIRESEDRFRTVSEYSHNGICIIDLSGKIIWANDSLAKIGGYSKEQMCSTESFIQFIAPESVEFVVGNFMKFAAGEEYEHHYSFYFIKSNGEKRLCEKHMTDYKDRSGNRFLTISMMDVTDDKKAENELRESEEKFRQLADSTTAGIFIHGGDKFQYINNTTAIHTGFSQEELYKMNFIDLVYPDDRQMIIDIWNARNKGDRIADSYECRLNKKDGGFIWAEISANLLDFKGKKALIGTAFDITDRKIAEEKLRKSESTLQKIFNILPIGLWFADKTGKLINGNPAGVKIWGAEPKVSTEEYSVFKARRLPSMIELASDDWALAKTIKKGVTIENELLEIDAFDGRKKIILNYTAPILDDDGKVLGAIVINEDITEKHNAEIEKEKLKDQLAQAQKMESIGRLAGGVAHDFNNMLSVIIGRTELAMMKTDPQNPSFKELVEIKNAAERSANLTGQLLAFARKQVITPKVVSLNDELGKTFEMLKRLIGENIKLSWKKGKDLWNIKIDPVQIDQIVANLCVNSKDAIKGDGNIVIETENVTLSQEDLADLPGINIGDFVVLKVSDDGSGMDDETVKHIFEPFFTTKDIGKGTGLGLATVFGIVKQNQGFIYVESKLEEGAVFKIYLPRQTEKTTRTDKEKSSMSSSYGGHTILLVEDEQAILEMGELMLQNFGYTVIAASSPQEAIQKAVKHSGTIDLLITDVIMPEMNGRELSKKITSLYPEIRCLFMSGYTADIIAHQGVVDEKMNFIQKPFSIKNLGEKVKTVMGVK